MTITINSDEISDSLQESIHYFKEHSLTLIELRSINKKNLLDLSIEEVHQVKQLLDKNHLQVAAIASPLFKWFYNRPLSNFKFDSFFFNPILTKNQKKTYIDKAIQIADILETNNIRIFSNLSDGTLTPESFWEDEVLSYCLLQAEKRRKFILLENEPICTIHSKRDIISTFTNPKLHRLKFWLDIANVYQVGESVTEEDISQLSDKIAYIHLKNFQTDPKFSFVPLGDGYINYKRIISDISRSCPNAILSLETHVKQNKIAATTKSLEVLEKYVGQKRISYAIIGAGRIACKHGNGLRENYNCELRGVYDIDPQKTDAFAKKNDIKNYLTLTNVLNDKTVQVITICTPHDTHINIAKKAVKKHKKVLCEKPFALSSKDLKNALKNNSIRSNVYIVLQNNFNPAVRFLYNLIQKNELGIINYFSINLRWWRDASYYTDWHGKKKHAGGSLYNQAIHSLGIINRIIPLCNFHSATFISKFTKKSEIEDLVVAIVKNNKRQQGTIEIFTHASKKNVESSLFISGSEGCIKIGGIAVNQVTHLHTKHNIPIPKFEDTHSPYGNGHSALLHAFSNHLINKKTTESNLLVRVSELKNIVNFIDYIYSQAR